jgi:hypothetical protein
MIFAGYEFSCCAKNGISLFYSEFDSKTCQSGGEKPNMTRFANLIAVAGFVTLLSSCSSLKLDHVQFGWPVESVLNVTNANLVQDVYHGLSFNVARIAGEEFQDTTALAGKQIRLLRSNEGFYFLTGQKFRNVYVFTPGAHELSLKSRIAVSPGGMQDPAFNQRPPYVQVLDGKNFQKMLTSDDIVEGKQE